VIHHGDCLDVMAGMDAASVDAIVTDPPYDLIEPRSLVGFGTSQRNGGRSEAEKAARRGGFMGKSWDGTGIAFRPRTWEEAFRVAKPGAYLLAFGGTRTYHRMTCAIEDAGWIIRDCLVWAYASGFPKSKALLKPAWEPIVMARKPGPLRELAIDACRIPHAGSGDLEESQAKNPGRDGETVTSDVYGADRPQQLVNVVGRWPSNVVLTSPIFDGDTPGVVGGGIATTHPGKVRGGAVAIYGNDIERTPWDEGPGDSGTYSRFFLIPKADRAEREPVLGGLPLREYTTAELRDFGAVDGNPRKPATGHISHRANHHPTVKPLDLMRHLVRLVTPTDGLVLDPFLGSGTTGLAAEMEGFRWVGIEREAEYVAIAEARLNGTQKGLGI